MTVWLASYPGSGIEVLRTLLEGAGAATVDAGGGAGRAAVSPGLFVETQGFPEDNGKAIYLVRDGRAAIAAFFDEISRRGDMPPVSVRDLITGKIGPGSWSEHVEAWAPWTRPNTLLVRYSDLIKHEPEVLARVAAFLDLPALESAGRRPVGAKGTEPATGTLEGQDRDLFWWLHGVTMVKLQFADAVPQPVGPGSPQTWFLDEVRRGHAEKIRQGGHLDWLAARLTQTEAEREEHARVASALRHRLHELSGSSWIKLGHDLRVTRALRHIRSELSRPAPALTAAEMPVAPTVSPEVEAFHATSTARALERIKRRGLPLGTVIDVGASNGMWSEVTEKVFPEARYVLVEAQAYHRDALEDYCRNRPGAEYVLAAAGDRIGEIFFDDRTPFGGVASHEATDWAKTSVPVVTLDSLVEERKLPGPFLVKLDTHGFEVPILKGAEQTLKSANLVVIEVYNFRILDDSLLFDEMCRFMRERGFGVIDISEPLWRDRDLAFWQMDLFFVPLSRDEFTSRSFS